MPDNSNLLEKVGMALISVRVLGLGKMEEMVLDSLEGTEAFEEEGEPGAFLGLNIKVDGPEYISQVFRYKEAEWDDYSASFFNGSDPDLREKVEAGGFVCYSDWENPERKDNFLYTSQIIASMHYGMKPYAPGEYDLVSLLHELGIDEFNLFEPEEGIGWDAVDENPNRKAELKLTEMFLTEAIKRGIDPLSFVGINYSID